MVLEGIFVGKFWVSGHIYIYNVVKLKAGPMFAFLMLRTGPFFSFSLQKEE